MNDQQPQWPKQQQTWSPSHQGRQSPQSANTPSRQFKRPLSLSLPHEQQQDSQAHRGQQFPQHDGQWKQPQRHQLLQLPAHPHSPLPSSGHFKRWLWLVVGTVALIVLFASIEVRPLATEGNTTSQTVTTSQVGQSLQAAQQAATQLASQPTTIATQAQAHNWMTTHTFTGSNEKKTNTFYIGDAWKIIWTCNPGTIFGGMGIIIVNVFSSDGIFHHGAINDTCKAGHTTGNTIENKGGNIYLDITGGGNWVIQVQELK